MASRVHARMAGDSGAARGRPAAVAWAGLFGSALFGAGIAGLLFAAGAQAQTENEQRYEIDQRLHIIYYSPEAFGCVSANNAKNIAAAISKTQAEIRLIQSELSAFPPINSGLSADDSTYVASLTGISVHLSNILSRLRALPPCRVELPPPGTNGPPPDDTTETNNAGANQNGGEDLVVPQGDLGGNGENGQIGQGASPCWPGSDASDQGNCPQDQYGLNRPNQHGDNGNGHHNNH